MKYGVAISASYNETPVSQVRFGLAQQFVREASEFCEVFFADNSPSTEVVDVLRAAGGSGRPIADSALPCLGRAEALQLALHAGCDYILLTEPEKLGLISQLLAIFEEAERQNVDLLLLGRDAAAMKTHPQNMQETEPLGNERIAEISGLNYDWFMGAHVLSKKAAERYIELQSAPDAVWLGGSIFAAAQCIRDGMSHGAYVVEDYFYPEEQRSAEEEDASMNEKRRRIAVSISEGVEVIWRKQ